MMKHVTARANPLVKQLRRLVHESDEYRRSGLVWLEGDHLCRAYRQKVGAPRTVVLSESGAARAAFADLYAGPDDVVVLDDSLFEQVSGLRSATGVSYLVSSPVAARPRPDAASIVLDRLQDPGNVGTILRSAAAFGFHQVVALAGTCALWSPKVLRAGMGAHFSLSLVEGVAPGELQLSVPLVGTSSHADAELPEADLPWPCAWVMGQEGRGMSDEVMRLCARTVRIPQPGGEESLNVAAAASVCMYATAARRRTDHAA